MKRRPTPSASRWRSCKACGAPFVSTQSANGKWPSACSPRCKLVVLDRFLGRLGKQRARLVAELEERAAGGQG